MLPFNSASSFSMKPNAMKTEFPKNSKIRRNFVYGRKGKESENRNISQVYDENSSYNNIRI